MPSKRSNGAVSEVAGTLIALTLTPIPLATTAFAEPSPPVPPALVQKLITLDLGLGDELGKSVAFKEPFAIAGAWSASSEGVQHHGAAQVWRYSPTGWVWESFIVPSDLPEGALFGSAVAIARPAFLFSLRTAAAIGAPGVAGGTGAVYINRRAPDGTWTEEGVLKASDGQPNARFGRSVAMSGDRVAIGAPQRNNFRGAVYVYRVVNKGGQAPTWIEEAIVTANDATVGDGFGESVAMVGDRLFAGAWGKEKLAVINQGAVYAFERNGAVWTQKAKLYATDGVALDEMGRSIAIDETGDTIVAGTSPTLSTGLARAHVFERHQSSWVQAATLAPPVTQVSDGFASSLALDGDLIIAGAPARTVGPHVLHGSAFVFTRASSADGWVFSDELLDPDGATGDAFGSSVSINGEAAMLGARGFDPPQVSNAGAALIFWIRDCDDDGAFGVCNPPSGDVNADGLVNGLDLALLLGAWGPSEPGTGADLNSDGDVNGEDLAILLGEWTG